MDTDKRMESGNLPDDVMLSSAEDLNNDGSFMGASDNRPGAEDWEDEKLDQAVAELMESEEPEDAQIDSEYSEEEVIRETPQYTPPKHPEARHSHRYADIIAPRPQTCRCEHEDKAPERPVVVIPDAAKPGARDDKSCGPLGERAIEMKPAMPAPAQNDDAHHVGVNKAALIWMIVLTIVLGGVIGIMIYAFILDRIDTAQMPEPDPDSSLQENLNAVAGALEVYLTEVNLDNYNTDIVLVNGGGTVSIKGTLRHSVFINTTSALTLVLNGVTIETEEGPAIANLTSNALTVRVDGMNTLIGAGGSYGAALYSNGNLAIRGDGQVMVYSSGSGSQAIATKNGYQIDGGAVVALGQAGVERPLDDSTQAYFAKDLSQLYRKGTLVSASDEAGIQVVKFTAPGDFSSIFVSNSKLEDGVQYSISLGGGGAN